MEKQKKTVVLNKKPKLVSCDKDSKSMTFELDFASVDEEGEELGVYLADEEAGEADMDSPMGIEDYNSGTRIIPYYKITERLRVTFEPGSRNACYRDLCEIVLDASQSDLDMTIAVCHELIHNFNEDFDELLAKDAAARRKHGIGPLKSYNLDETRAVYNSVMAYAVLECWEEYKRLIAKKSCKN